MNLSLKELKSGTESETSDDMETIPSKPKTTTFSNPSQYADLDSDKSSDSTWETTREPKPLSKEENNTRDNATDQMCVPG